MAWYCEFPASSDVDNYPDKIALAAGRGEAKLIDAANRAQPTRRSPDRLRQRICRHCGLGGRLAAYVKANNIQVAATVFE